MPLLGYADRVARYRDMLAPEATSATVRLVMALMKELERDLRDGPPSNPANHAGPPLRDLPPHREPSE